MSINIDGNSLMSVRAVVKNGVTPITNTNPIDIEVKNVLIKAFEAIPNQAGGTATVAAIVTALKTIV